MINSLTKVKNREKAITLMALVITIVILIILASISIAALTGDNGLMNKAGEAKISAEEKNEMEIIELSTVTAMRKDKKGELLQDEFQKALNSNAGENEAKVYDSGDCFTVIFEKSQRAYTVDKEGKATSEGTIQKDELAGDITKGGECTGGSDAPYRITCIEDLVAFSRGIANTTISGNCYVILTRTLNFKSILSYADYTQTYSYNSEENSYVKDESSDTTLMELCTTGKGFIPIGNRANGYQNFQGNFDGQNNEIRNLYINTNAIAGLFGRTGTCTIQNLTVTGEVTSTESCAAGIVATEWNTSTTTIRNCHNKANVTAYSHAGGVFGGESGNGVEGTYIYDSSNSGTIISTNGTHAGGIVAGGYANCYGCYNTGDISLEGTFTWESSIGGIGGSYPIIENCYNTGKIETERPYCGTGGITGCYSGTKGEISNCYNVGDISFVDSWPGRPRCGIGGLLAHNCYNIGTVTVGNTNKHEILKGTRDKCYYSSSTGNQNMGDINDLTDISSKTLNEFVELLNSYRETKDGNQVWPEGWKRWKAGDKGYPVFE